MQHRTQVTVADPPLGGALATNYRPVWQILDEARARGFTGEIVMLLDPQVFAYFDNGVIYVAERADEAPIGERLIAAGVIDRSDLEDGAVRIGDVEHLGRLFERRPELDRDRALVATELATETLVTELAATENCSIRFTAYRHHPAGLHRWFAAPFAARTEFTPSAAADRGTIDDLSALPLTPDGSGGQLYIEWDEPILGLDGDAGGTSIEIADAELADDLRSEVDDSGVTPVSELDDQVADLDGYRVLYDDVDEEPGGGFEVDVDEPVPSAVEIIPLLPDDLDEASDDVIPASEPIVDDAPTEPAATHHIDEADDWVTIPVDVAGDDALVTPTVETDGADFRVSVPSDADDVESNGAPADTVNDDDAVADAVRRAITAIEDATVEWDTDTVSDGAILADAPITTEVPVQAPAAPVTGSPFAPPTPEMSAEAMYARVEAAEPDAERTSALRRLIGGIRRK
ncbi:MAG: hypothetical protein AAGA42_08065 [Actinomycetota bacterium]